MPKERKPSPEQRANLADRIEKCCFVMAVSCRQCRNSGETSSCRLSLKHSGHCSNCVRKGVSCQLLVKKADFDALDRKRSEYRSQLRAAKVAQQEALSKQLRLEQYLEDLESKEKELFARGLETAEALQVQEGNIAAGVTGTPSLGDSELSVPLDADWFAALGDIPSGIQSP